jgi:putative polyketide hydroxylase
MNGKEPAAMHANDMNDQRFDYDVIVIGAGPSGLTTATALARSGVRVLVVEKHNGLSIFPKATGIRPRSMEILRGWGLEAEVRRRSQPNQLGMAISPTLGAPRHIVDLGLPSDEVISAATPTRLAICGQDQLEQVLLDHLRARGGTIHFHTEMVGFSQTDDAVSVTLRTRDRQASYQIMAQYLVGADGGRSQVRAGAGIEFEPLGSEGNHLAILFDADLSAVLPDPPYILNAVVAPGVEGLFATTGRPTRWIYDMEWHPEAGEQLEDWTSERITARLRAASGLPDLNPKIIGVFPWDFGAGVADGYRWGRVFLVGDAAHRTTPRGATGMNTGIADGHNLGWKLAWVIKGLAQHALLDSYEAEREPVGRANATASLQTMIDRPPQDGLAQDFGVEYTSAAIVGGTPLAGQRAPHAWTELRNPRAMSSSNGPGPASTSSGRIRRVSTIDLFDGSFTLITGPDAQLWRAAATELAETGVPFSVLSLGAELADPYGELVSRYQLTTHGCVLVRPDGYVTWGCDGAPEGAGDRLRDVVRLATGHRVADLVR